MELNERNVTLWLEANPRFAQTDRNIQTLAEMMKLAAMKPGREIDTIEKLNSLVSLNRDHFEWLRSQEEINAAVAAATPKPEPPKQGRLKGLTPAERLYQLGVPVSDVVRAGMAHSDREQNDSKQSSVIRKMAEEARTTQAKIERQHQIDEARNIVVYRAGRVSHGETESARKAALAKLGIFE